VPGVVNWCANVPPASIAPESKLVSLAVTVCWTPSWLLQVTVVPAEIVSVAGVKLKLSIAT
jgi:hypothetical protein